MSLRSRFASLLGSSTSQVKDGTYGFGRNGNMLWSCDVKDQRIVHLEHTGIKMDDRDIRVSEVEGFQVAPIFASTTTWVVRGMIGHDPVYAFLRVK